MASHRAINRADKQQCHQKSGGIVVYWWSRRELNPRPQVRYSKFYMRILLI